VAGAPIVFLPGAGGSASFWRPVAERLEELGPTVLFGYPGFGDEPADRAVRSLEDLHRWIVARLPPRPCHVVAQSMGGVLAARLAIEHPQRVLRLVLAATSGGVDVKRLGAAEWRDEYRAERPHVPPWFVDDRTDLTERLHELRTPTLLLWSDADPVSPLAIAEHLAERIAGARVAIVPGGSHAFASERADEVAEILRAYLR
jgi:pimeloyl-ACP methyl ester carboxylesterase